MKVLIVSLLLLAALPAAALSLTAEDLEKINRVLDFVDVLEYYSEIPGLFDSFNQCLANGYDPDLCTATFTYCAINEVPLGGIAGAFWDAFQLNQLFRVNCGDGICFACCYVPGKRFPCHTAFYDEDGRPVINCNANYGAGTTQAGPTLIVDPDAQPGDACLFTGQTCDHLALCESGGSPEEIAAINANPSHIMKSLPAVQSRAREFGSRTLGSWSAVLDDFHTSTPYTPGTFPDRIASLYAMGDFITGRGCVGWKTRFPASFPADWNEPPFRINDASGNYAAGPSHLNGLRQIGLVRTLASIPNLYNRLAFVESRIWTPESKAAYLAQLGEDADSVFLENMSPTGLKVLKRNAQLQDYRLLAVRLTGETASRTFNGCTLGLPPAVRLTVAKSGALGISLQIHATDSATTAAGEVAVIVLWGDGTVEKITIPPGGAARSASHDYARGGRYQILAVAQNDSGLRAVGAAIAETQGNGTGNGSDGPPIISEVQLVDLRAEIESNGNAFSMMFGLQTWATPSEGYVLGISRAIELPLRTPTSFGTLAGRNMRAVPLRSVTIRTSRFGKGILLGFRSTYFTVGSLRLGVYSTEDNALRYIDVPVTPDMVRLHMSDSGTPVLLTQPVYGADGRLRIPFELPGGVRYPRIDLLIPDPVFAQTLQPPVSDAKWVGVSGALLETRPDDPDSTEINYGAPPRRRAVRH